MYYFNQTQMKGAMVVQEERWNAIASGLININYPWKYDTVT